MSLIEDGTLVGVCKDIVSLLRIAYVSVGRTRQRKYRHIFELFFSLLLVVLITVLTTRKPDQVPARATATYRSGCHFIACLR